MYGRKTNATASFSKEVRHMKMRCVTILVLICPAVFLSACVSSTKYRELETALADTSRQAEQRYNDLSVKLDEARQISAGCLAELAALKNEYRRMLAANRNMEQHIGSLSDENAFLKFEKEKKSAAMHLQEEAISQMDDTRAKIESDLDDQIASREIRIEELDGKLKVTFVDKILFDSGSHHIKPLGQQILLKLSESIRTDPNDIVVEGHTDNVGIKGALKERFPTNWELSTARAGAVVRFFQEKGGIDPKRLSACGYGSYRPAASNETETGRRENRRIEIILAPRQQ